MPFDRVAIGRDPRAYRDVLVFRGPQGPDTFSNRAVDFQLEVLESFDAAFVAVREDRDPPVKRVFWEGSKGCSKDTISALMILWLLSFTRRSITVEVGAADRAQADFLRKAADEILRLNNAIFEGLIEIQNWRIVNTHTGSRCEILSADEAGAHGSRPDVTIANEITHHPSSGFFETMMDNATKVPRNVTIVLTNAGFRNTWQWKVRELARTSPSWKFYSLTRPVPWISESVLAERRMATTEARFLRLWFTEWADESETAIAEGAIRAACVSPGPQLVREHADESFFGGLDLGVRKDHSALCILRRRPDQRPRVAWCQSWKPVAGLVDLTAVKDAIVECHRRYSLFTMLFDVSQAELMAMELRPLGVPMVACNFTMASLQEMASCLIETFNSSTIELFDHPELIRDLKALRFTERGTGYRLEAPHTADGHGDLGTAFTLALLAHKRNPFAYFRPFVDGHIVLEADDTPVVESTPETAFRNELERAKERHRERSELPADALEAILRENNLLTLTGD